MQLLTVDDNSESRDEVLRGFGGWKIQWVTVRCPSLLLTT